MLLTETCDPIGWLQKSSLINLSEPFFRKILLKYVIYLTNKIKNRVDLKPFHTEKGHENCNSLNVKRKF